MDNNWICKDCVHILVCSKLKKLEQLTKFDIEFINTNVVLDKCGDFIKID